MLNNVYAMETGFLFGQCMVMHFLSSDNLIYRIYKKYRPFQSKVYPLSSTTGCMKKRQSYFAMF